MALPAWGQSKTPLAGTRSLHPVAAGHARVDTRVPVMCHDQSGQNGAFSSKKTKTGITAQPTMS